MFFFFVAKNDLFCPLSGEMARWTCRVRETQHKKAVDFLLEVFFVPFFGAQNDGCIFVVGHKNWHFFFLFSVGPSNLSDSFRPRS